MTRLTCISLWFVSCMTAAPVSSIFAQSQPHSAAIEISQFDSVVAPFVNEYCVDCHNVDQHEAERQFDSLAGEITSSDQLVDVQDILDQLNLGNMPPEEASQPPGKLRRQVIANLTEAIKAYQTSMAHRHESSIRRLSAREYRNSLADLLHLNMTMFDPTHAFPKDQTVEHLDNTHHLVTSGFLLERHLDAAEAVVGRVLANVSQPETQTWHFSDGFRQQPEIDQVHKHTTQFKHLTLYDVRGADKHEGAYGPIHAFSDGVPHDGYYEIEFSASAINRLHPYDDDFLRRDREEPLQLGIVAGFSAAGPLHKPQPIEPILARVDLADGKKSYKVRVWMDRGCTPRFTFENGLMDARTLWTKLIRKYPDQFKQGLKGIVLYRRNAIEQGKLPQIHVDDITIRGPIYEQWPTPPQRALLGPDVATVLQDQRFPSDQALQKQIRQLATRFYRRPATSADVTPLFQLISHRKSLGKSELEAFGDAVKAMLCSPNFLMLHHPSGTVIDGKAPELERQYATASKLAAFLWSSCPDTDLLSSASNGVLGSREQISRQAERMLSVPRAERFVRDFLDAWLNLRDLGATPPDRGLFSQYYQFDLRPAMREESQRFFQHILTNNLPLEQFIDSDFTFVNKRLAQLYDIPFQGKNTFRKVPVPSGNRGGLLGQASVLTVSANGIDTSPVVRGVWILENLLASPPAPPPPDVEPLDPDTRGSTTIREQLAKHRNVPSCNNCHRKIDPLGFAMENFDAIGAWRTQYDGKKPIDASATLPSGKHYRDIVEFKSHLLNDRQKFYRGFVSKLLAYAHGRPTGPLDRPEIDSLTDFSLQDGVGLLDIVLEVAASF